MQNAECKMQNDRHGGDEKNKLEQLPHSAFCILHSALWVVPL